MRVLLGGEGGIRTPARFHVCWFSKPVPSASWVLLRNALHQYSTRIAMALCFVIRIIGKK